MAQGKSAQILMASDLPHAVAYVPDIGRAAVTLLDAPDDAFNQVWHVPCAPTRTPRELLQIGADAVGRPLKLMAMPTLMLRAIGLFSPFCASASNAFHLEPPLPCRCDQVWP